MENPTRRTPFWIVVLLAPVVAAVVAPLAGRAEPQAPVPVVEVTETVPPGTTQFETWQVAQLTALAKALGVAV